MCLLRVISLPIIVGTRDSALTIMVKFTFVDQLSPYNFILRFSLGGKKDMLIIIPNEDEISYEGYYKDH